MTPFKFHLSFHARKRGEAFNALHRLLWIDLYAAIDGERTKSNGECEHYKEGVIFAVTTFLFGFRYEVSSMDFDTGVEGPRCTIAVYFCPRVKRKEGETLYLKSWKLYFPMKSMPSYSWT